MTNLVEVTREAEGIVTVWLNRPDRMNAFNLAMWEALGTTFRQVNADESVRRLRGRARPRQDGRVAFGAGGDISEFPELRADAAQAEAYAERMELATTALSESPHPSVALIQGVCAGGGLELALHCDLRIAGEGARLGIPIQRIGHALPLSALRPLVQLCGRAVALELLLEGRFFDAQEALIKGLVNRVVPAEQAPEEAMATALRVARGAPLAHRFHREATHRALRPKAYSPAEKKASFALCDSEDYREGVRAFLAKEDPVFKGR